MDTGATGATYVLGDADVGAQISVRANYTDAHGTAEAVISAATAAVANVNDAPTGSVTISGTPTEDQTLTASNTLNDADGLGSITYHWLRGGVDTGATGSSYVLGDADVGARISVRANYTDLHGTAEAVTSTATAVVANVNDAPTGSVTISGTPTEDQTLTASNTLADVDGPGSITYHWLRGGVDTGATGSTYVLGDADVGAQISVRANYTDLHGTAEAVTSTATAAVANVNDAPTGSVTISGTPTEDQTLTASNTLADVDGLGSITYHWLRGGVDTGATGSSYVLGDADVGAQISVIARYTDLHGHEETVLSNVTAEISNAISPGAEVFLTTYNDHLFASASDTTIIATAATLNAGDQLSGGDGHDELVLVGPGTFNVAALATFDGFEEIRINNISESSLSDVYLPDADVTVSGSGQNVSLHFSGGSTIVDHLVSGSVYGGTINYYLSTGDATVYASDAQNNYYLSSGDYVLSGGNSSDQFNVDTSSALGSNVIDGGGSSSDYLRLRGSGQTYDLTAADLSNIEYLVLNASSVTVRASSQSLASFTEINSPYGNGKVTTADATLDLSGKQTYGVQFSSSNANGTVFTTNNLATAFSVIGGAGDDTVVINGFTLTSSQREAIFATTSIETIQDQSGTYVIPELTKLTSGLDTIPPSASDTTIIATAATLNAGDQLSGGDGHDELVLVGPGTFNVAALATFDGFEEIRINNISESSLSDVYLPDADVTVSGSGQNVSLHFSGGSTIVDHLVSGSVYGGTINYYLSTGDATVYASDAQNNYYLSSGDYVLSGGNSSDQFNVDTSSALGSNVIDGGGSSSDYLRLRGSGQTYDLTAADLSNIEYLVLNASSVTVRASSQSLASFTEINSPYGNGKVTTADATLDLSGKQTYGVQFSSSNANGTVFTTNNLATAFSVIGGAGDDTVVINGFTLTSSQREAIFATTSIETIQDQSGTYVIPELTKLTSGLDTIPPSASDTTIIATAATLNAGDQLSGGDGHDELVLVGPGTFNVAALATFDGFEEIRINNISESSLSDVYLPDADVTVSGSGQNVSLHFSGGSTIVDHLVSGSVYGGTINYYLSTGDATVYASDAQNNYYLSSGDYVLSGGNSSDQFNVDTSSALGSNVIDGGGSSSDYLRLRGSGQTYDLTAADLSNIEYLVLNASSVTVRASSQSLASFTEINSPYGNGKVTTADATLDLSGKQTYGVQFSSSNANGTVFTTNNLATAFSVIGGAGDDTVVINGFTLTSSQREAIFATTSIETIQDQYGVYDANGLINVLPTGSVTISGTATPTEDQTLTASNTLADADGLGAITYHWLRSGVDTGATGSSYMLGDADVGLQISVRANYTDGHGAAESVTSAATAAVANVNDIPTGSVTISGTPTEDQTLTASNTLADADGLGPISYQWQSDGVDISGATGSSHTLGDADVGHSIKVVASYADGHGTAESVASAATAAVAGSNAAPTVANLIADQIATEDSAFSFVIPGNTFNDVNVGDHLTYSATLANGLVLPSWLHFDAAAGTFSGTPVNADVGTLQVKVTASDDSNASVSDTFDIAVANTNDAPTVTGSIAVQPIRVDDVFSLTIPTNLFTDIDAGDHLTITAGVSGGGGLPSWLSYDSSTGIISGTPSLTDAGLVQLTLTATDIEGAIASILVPVVVVNQQAIVGTSGTDNLTGTVGGDTIYGLAGNDTIDGSAGADYIDGGADDDVLTGGNGSDVLIGGDGSDQLSDGGSNDVLLGGTGDDNLSLSYSGASQPLTQVADGGEGNNSFNVNNQTNSLLSYQLTGGSGSDYFNINNGGQFAIDAGSGVNNLYLYDSTYDGPTTSGTFSGGDGQDYFNANGYIGNWTVDTGGGADNINFAACGELALQPGSYNFTIHAGDDNDLIICWWFETL